MLQSISNGVFFWDQTSTRRPAMVTVKSYCRKRYKNHKLISSLVVSLVRNSLPPPPTSGEASYRRGAGRGTFNSESHFTLVGFTGCRRRHLLFIMILPSSTSEIHSYVCYIVLWCMSTTMQKCPHVSSLII